MDHFAFTFTFYSITLDLAALNLDGHSNHHYSTCTALSTEEGSVRDSQSEGTSACTHHTFPFTFPSLNFVSLAKNEAPINPRALSRQPVLIGFSQFTQPVHPLHSKSAPTLLFGLGCDGPVFHEDRGKKRSWDYEECHETSTSAPTPRSSKRIRRDLEKAVPTRAKTAQRVVRQSPRLRQQLLPLPSSSTPIRNIPRGRVLRMTSSQLIAAGSRAANSSSQIN